MTALHNIQVVFDGSEDIGVILLDGIRLYCGDDKDAKKAFDIINELCTEVQIYRLQVQKLAMEFDRLYLAIKAIER